MGKRLLFGPLLIAALLGFMILDQVIAGKALPGGKVFGLDHFPRGTILFFLSVVVSVLGAREMAKILSDNGIVASKRILTFAAIVGLLVSCLVPASLPAMEAVAIVSTSAVLVLSVALAFYSRRNSFEGIVAAAGGALLAFVYLGLMFGFFLAIRREYSIWVLFWIILMIKASDIGAYFTGKSIGRHKLIFWLSPGKTWEGLFGGVILAAAAAAAGGWLLGRYALEPAPAWWISVLAGGIAALVGQGGDLIMSLFKRDAGIKDSGSSIPGFGGVLDVIDSPLLVAPLAFWWLRAVMPLSAQ